MPRNFIIYFHESEHMLTEQAKQKNWPKLTVAVSIDDEGRIYTGTALCSKKDSKIFNKRLGRKIAEGRLQKHPLLVGTIPVGSKSLAEVDLKAAKARVYGHVSTVTSLLLRKHRESAGNIITGRDDYGHDRI